MYSLSLLRPYEKEAKSMKHSKDTEPHPKKRLAILRRFLLKKRCTCDWIEREDNGWWHCLSSGRSWVRTPFRTFSPTYKHNICSSTVYHHDQIGKSSAFSTHERPTYPFWKIIKKSEKALPGFEPGISCLLDRRINRYATAPQGIEKVFWYLNCLSHGCHVCVCVGVCVSVCVWVVVSTFVCVSILCNNK